MSTTAHKGFAVLDARTGKEISLAMEGYFQRAGAVLSKSMMFYDFAAVAGSRGASFGRRHRQASCSISTKSEALSDLPQLEIPEDLLLELASRLEPDGGMRGDNPAERLTLT